MHEEDYISRTQEMVRENNEIPTDDYTQYLAEEDYDFTLDTSLINISKCTASLKEFYSRNFMDCLKLVPSYSPSTLTKSMVFFLRKSKTLVNIDVKSLDLTKKEVKIDESQGSRAGWCRLPGAKIFHCGGQVSTFQQPLNYCMIIDLLSNTIQKMQDVPEKKYTIGTCAYLDQYVYVFGGSGVLGALLYESERLDIAANKWTIVQRLPIPSDYNSTVVLDRNILVTGMRLGVLVYNVDTNKYGEEIAAVDGHKVMISEGESVYILHANTLIERCFGRWTCVNENIRLPDEESMACYPVKCGAFIYFLLSNNILYRFDIMKKNIEKVKQYAIS